SPRSCAAARMPRSPEWARAPSACGSSPISSFCENSRMNTLTGELSAEGYNPSMYELLKTINDPAELRKLDRKQLHQLADELRAFVLDSVSETGGHLSVNLGTGGLTVARY